MSKFRSDLIIEAAQLAAFQKRQSSRLSGRKVNGTKASGGKQPGIVFREVWNKEHSMKVSIVRILSKGSAKRIGRPVGNYITIELPRLLEEEEHLKQVAERELGRQLKRLLTGKKAEHMLVVGLGNREVIADAVGPFTIEGILVTRHLFKVAEASKAGKSSGLEKYRQVSALVPGVMAQTGMETMELIKGVVKEVKPDVVLVIDALAAGSPGRLNTTIQLTDTGISPGAGVGNNRKELNEASLGCPVIAIGVPTVMDAATIACDKMKKEVAEFFVTPRNIDSSVQYVSELLAGGINQANTFAKKETAGGGENE